MVKIVEANTEIYNLERLDDILTHIERCGRTCYKSENLITNETAKPFITGILKTGHESVTEHANVIFTMPNTDKNRKIFEMTNIRGINASKEFDTLEKREVIVVSGNIRALRDIARVYNVHDFLLLIGDPLFILKEDATLFFDNAKIEAYKNLVFQNCTIM